MGPLLGIVEGQFVGTKKTKLKNNFSKNYKNLPLLIQSFKFEILQNFEKRINITKKKMVIFCESEAGCNISPRLKATKRMLWGVKIFFSRNPFFSSDKNLSNYAFNIIYSENN